MTDFNPTPNAQDLADDMSAERVRLDEAGDRWIEDAERGRMARQAGLRRAVRSDLESGRAWARERADLARARIADRPMKATLYALGVGVLIGVLLRR